MTISTSTSADGGKHPAHPVRRTPDKAERILDAALVVFARAGVHGTPVPPIAEEAGVGVGTLYRYFKSKEALVNAVFRRCKEGLYAHLLTDLDASMGYRELFEALWDRLRSFADQQPDAFQFLEMQDHLSYLDADSRRAEEELLRPLREILVRAAEAGVLARGLRPDVGIALTWGGFVGLVKAARLGYLELNDADFLAARDASLAILQRQGEG